jgi:DNA-directed RNA polymerase specialized sigma24 family protein
MSGPITHAVERCKQQQDSEALHELERALQPFLQEMIRLVRRRRKTALQARVDSQAIINAALHSFIKGVGSRQFPQLQNQEDVKRVLTTLVVRTLLNEVAWNHSQQRDVAREQRLDEDGMRGLPEKASSGDATRLLDPTFADWLEAFLAVVEGVHPKAENIVCLSLEGYANEEIAARLGLSTRWVQRTKQAMRAAWEKAQAGGA